MPRKKLAIGFYEMGDSHEGLSPEAVCALRVILECEEIDDLVDDLNQEIDGWLIRFGSFRQYRFGAAELQTAKRAQQAAGILHAALTNLGSIGDIALDHFAYRQRIRNDAFLAAVESLNGLVEYLEDLAEPELNVAAMQIQALAGSLLRHGHAVTATHSNTATAFTPSPFVRVVEALWDAEPRLRLYEGYSADYWPNLSQWVSARLAEDADPTTLKLVRRKKLE